jgi:hypothetical protein
MAPHPPYDKGNRPLRTNILRNSYKCRSNNYPNRAILANLRSPCPESGYLGRLGAIERFPIVICPSLSTCNCARSLPPIANVATVTVSLPPLPPCHQLRPATSRHLRHPSRAPATAATTATNKNKPFFTLHHAPPPVGLPPPARQTNTPTAHGGPARPSSHQDTASND